MNDLQTPCAGSASRADSVDAILSRRSTTESYEDRCQYALDLVCVYLQEENAQRLEQCLRLCAFDAVWEAPLRNVSYDGLSAISATCAICASRCSNSLRRPSVYSSIRV